jgi:histidinol phosphatase-like PHP family hydrolase
VAALLGDLAAVQENTQKQRGYNQAAGAILALDIPLERLVGAHGTLPRIPRIGPSSSRVIMEVLATGASATVDDAVASSKNAADIQKRRQWRDRFLSRARVRAILGDATLTGLAPEDHHADLQMHSTWSDGSQTLDDIFETGISRGYVFSAVTDHSGGLPIAGGVSPERLAEQATEIDRLNAQYRGRFHLLKGVEANIRADGTVDVEPSDRHRFDVIVAAPHAALRSPDPQTARMLAAVTAPGIHILGHPRGRKFGSRPGVSADWRKVFAAAAKSGVAIEIDGDPSRQDLDYELARQANDAGCLFALDSDAHSTSEWKYVDTAIAHARLAGISADRVVNCWPLDRFMDWARGRHTS